MSGILLSCLAAQSDDALTVTVGSSTTRSGYNINTAQPAYGSIAPRNTFSDGAGIVQTITSLHWDSAAGALRLTLPNISGAGANVDATFRTLRVGVNTYLRSAAAFGLNSPTLGANTWAWVVANPFPGAGGLITVGLSS